MRSQITRQLRRLHSYRASDPVDEDLRGWNYHTPPVKPRSYLSLSIGDVAYRYCETKRDVYLRKVIKVKGEQTPLLSLGQQVHEIIASSSRDISRLLAQGLPPYEVLEVVGRRRYGNCSSPYCEKVKKAFSFFLLSDASDSSEFIPMISEFRVDGSPLGLSRWLSADAVAQLSMVVEIKVGNPQDFHRLALSGYALALESALELPIDFGALIYVNGLNNRFPDIRTEVYYISTDLRKEFLDARDEVIEMVIEEKDPGLSSSCSTGCPFYSYCKK
ncbi:type I-A CRISPR-associated protein Cas4/Csa1 [Metallosphaera tengchongensis]|uniref:Type I-A CRISPR-associated protein Cas4/Csa1 n=1 Tax=Metallosphaera tengchongensis TaxID=1532350 RepID=A0A6N0NZE0_9CREN|nr:type I-A CRISPR-associated protein Cas4/Csa1 [Metallosphaera tengchongensis]QKR00728.1 type I-A CRISPR-associated protein Cas4/Csa1 [Metallosphaera tengchongensis]